MYVDKVEIDYNDGNKMMRIKQLVKRGIQPKSDYEFWKRNNKVIL